MLTFDILIRGGRIVDGTGNTWFRGDVAIDGDTIVAIAPKLAGDAGRVIDATGKVVAPGFIDLHTHARGGQTLAELGEIAAGIAHESATPSPRSSAT